VSATGGMSLRDYALPVQNSAPDWRRPRAGGGHTGYVLCQEEEDHAKPARDRPFGAIIVLARLPGSLVPQGGRHAGPHMAGIVQSCSS
jgi:hypothetical protein